jgi:DNA invertase Pin-like site-specific DNA recombinase
VITLLQERYTYSKIQTKTGLGKATISRVKAEALADKENNPAGHPSKLTTYDK